MRLCDSDFSPRRRARHPVLAHVTTLLSEIPPRPGRWPTCVSMESNTVGVQIRACHSRNYSIAIIPLPNMISHCNQCTWRYRAAACSRGGTASLQTVAMQNKLSFKALPEFNAMVARAHAGLHICGQICTGGAHHYRARIGHFYWVRRDPLTSHLFCGLARLVSA